jgi:hypothetical protein
LHTEFQAELENAQHLMEQAAGIRALDKSTMQEQEQRRQLNLKARQILERLLQH